MQHERSVIQAMIVYGMHDDMEQLIRRRQIADLLAQEGLLDASGPKLRVRGIKKPECSARTCFDRPGVDFDGDSPLRSYQGREVFATLEPRSFAALNRAMPFETGAQERFEGKHGLMPRHEHIQIPEWPQRGMWVYMERQEGTLEEYRRDPLFTHCAVDGCDVRLQLQ